MKMNYRFSAAVLLCGMMSAAGSAAGDGGVMVSVDERGPVNARVALLLPIKELNVDSMALSQVMDYFRSVSGANMIVKWKVLEAAGVGKDAAVTLHVTNLPLRKMMELALTQAAPNTELVIGVDQNVIEITTRDEADSHLVTRMYNVSDLLIPDHGDIAAPSMDLQQAGQAVASSSGGTSLFSNNTSQTSMDTKEKRGSDMVSVIEATVRPSIWKENGGPASIHYVMGQLVVTAPLSVQEAIAGVPRSEYLVGGKH